MKTLRASFFVVASLGVFSVRAMGETEPVKQKKDDLIIVAEIVAVTGMRRIDVPVTQEVQPLRTPTPFLPRRGQTPRAVTPCRAMTPKRIITAVELRELEAAAREALKNCYFDSPCYPCEPKLRCETPVCVDGPMSYDDYLFFGDKIH